MAEYIKREDALNAIRKSPISNMSTRLFCVDAIADIPAADVVERDEGIKMGAELAAMHGSDATSQELSKAYFDGMEEGYKKGRSGFEKRAMWIKVHDDICYWTVCSGCWTRLPRDDWGQEWRSSYCPNCGSRMVTDDV